MPWTKNGRVRVYPINILFTQEEREVIRKMAEAAYANTGTLCRDILLTEAERRGFPRPPNVYKRKS